MPSRTSPAVTASAATVRTASGTSITLPVDGAVTALTLKPSNEAAKPRPTVLKARPGHRSATLRWNLAGATGKVVAVQVKRPPGGVVRRLAPGTRRWRDTGLANGRRYTYTLRAVTRTGASGAGRSVAVVPRRAAR